METEDLSFIVTGLVCKFFHRLNLSIRNIETGKRHFYSFNGNLNTHRIERKAYRDLAFFSDIDCLMNPASHRLRNEKRYWFH